MVVYTTPVELDDELEDEVDDFELLLEEETAVELDELTTLEDDTAVLLELAVPPGTVPQTSIPFWYTVTLFQSV